MYTLVHFKPQENKDGGVQRYPMKSKVAGPLPNFGEIEPGSLLAKVNVEKNILYPVYVVYHGQRHEDQVWGDQVSCLIAEVGVAEAGRVSRRDIVNISAGPGNQLYSI